MKLSKSEAMGLLIVLAGINTTEWLAVASETGKVVLGQMIDMDEELTTETINGFLENALQGLDIAKQVILNFGGEL